MRCLRALPLPLAPLLPSARCPRLCISRGDSLLGVQLPHGPGRCPVGSKAAPWGPAPEGRGLQRLPTWAWLPLEGSARGQGWAKVKPDGLGAPRGRRAIRHRYLPCRQITNTFLSEGLAATGLRALMPPSCGHTAWGWGWGRGVRGQRVACGRRDGHPHHARALPCLQAEPAPSPHVHVRPPLLRAGAQGPGHRHSAQGTPPPAFSPEPWHQRLSIWSTRRGPGLPGRQRDMGWSSTFSVGLGAPGPLQGGSGQDES